MLSGERKRQGAIRELLQRIVEQFVVREGRGQTELRQFERLAGDLIDVTDSEIVATIAEPLCRHPDTPPALIRRFFDRGGDCARIAFEFAPSPPVADIIAKAAHGSAELAAAIARRSELPREAIGVLAARDEGVVLYALAANRRIHLDTGALRALMYVARDDQQLARVLLNREDLDVDPESLFSRRRETSERGSCRPRAGRRLSTELATSGVRDAQLAARLEALAAREERDATISLVADALDARKSRVRKIFLDEGGEALALTYVALRNRSRDGDAIVFGQRQGFRARCRPRSRAAGARVVDAKARRRADRRRDQWRRPLRPRAGPARRLARIAGAGQRAAARRRGPLGAWRPPRQFR